MQEPRVSTACGSRQPWSPAGVPHAGSSWYVVCLIVPHPTWVADLLLRLTQQLTLSLWVPQWLNGAPIFPLNSKGHTLRTELETRRKKIVFVNTEVFDRKLSREATMTD